MQHPWSTEQCLVSSRCSCVCWLVMLISWALPAHYWRQRDQCQFPSAGNLQLRPLAAGKPPPPSSQAPAVRALLGLWETKPSHLLDWKVAGKDTAFPGTPNKGVNQTPHLPHHLPQSQEGGEKGNVGQNEEWPAWAPATTSGTSILPSSERT